MGLALLIVLLMGGVAFVTSSVVRRTAASAPAQVHIDDLVLGRLPDRCAVTGVPTTHRMAVESSRGGFQPWWLLLLFLGPIGLLAIVVLAVLGRRSERVTGVLPISEDAAERYERVVRTARWASAAVVVLIAAAVVVPTMLVARGESWTLLLVALAGAALVTMLVAAALAPTRWIDLRLDGSGRWVTVERAHPDFATAVRQRYAEVGRHTGIGIG